MILHADKEVIAAIEADKRNEAIAFAEWILKSTNWMVHNDEEDWWQDEINMKEYTSEQLYDRYKTEMK